MPDVFTKEKRSLVMARIRGRGNKDTEIALAKLLREARITGWRRHLAILGKPDFTFREARLVVFVDGCFWHRCPKHSTLPSNNREFWLHKLESNQARDRLVTRSLRQRLARPADLGARALSEKQCPLSASNSARFGCLPTAPPTFLVSRCQNRQ